MLEFILPSLLMVIFLFLWHWKLEKIVVRAVFHRNSEKTESILINPYHPDDPEWKEFENKYMKINPGGGVKNAA